MNWIYKISFYIAQISFSKMHSVETDLRSCSNEWEEENLEPHKHESERIAKGGERVNSHLKEHMDRQCQQHRSHEKAESLEGSSNIF